MNGTITEKAFEKMDTSEKLWLLYNTMYAREQGQKKHFRRIYIVLAALVLSFIMHGGSEALSGAFKIIGMF